MLLLRFSLLVACVFVLAIAGCGNSGSKTSVAGKVTLTDGSIVAGKITFTGHGGKIATAPINPDGTYLVQDVAAGLNKITIEGFGFEAPTKDPPRIDVGGPPAPMGVAPPAKYATEAGELTLEVRAGKRNKHDIALEP